MDRFSKVITTNEMSIKAELPLPNRPKYSRLDISFDKFNEFINRYLSESIRLPLLQATIYDEAVITSQEDFNLRYQFLRKINELNFKKYHLDYQIAQCQFIMQLWKKLVGNIQIRLNYL